MSWAVRTFLFQISLPGDGIFDKLNNEDAAECIAMSIQDVAGAAVGIHKQVGMGVEYIIKNALLRRSLDNVTAVLVAFDGFLSYQPPEEPQPRQSIGKSARAAVLERPDTSKQ